jgi:hypothetical protein
MVGARIGAMDRRNLMLEPALAPDERAHYVRRDDAGEAARA